MIELNGKFQISPPLQGIHLAYLDKFSKIRHVKRDIKLLEKLRDPLREAVGLPIGKDGAYYIAAEVPTEYEDPTIVSYNNPPQEQPGLWCDWQPTGDGEFFIWINEDKNYKYDTWLEYLIKHFFNPWNYKLSGRIECNYYYCEYSSDNKEDEPVSYIEKSELVIIDGNILVENDLGTFIDNGE